MGVSLPYLLWLFVNYTVIKSKGSKTEFKPWGSWIHFLPNVRKPSIFKAERSWSLPAFFEACFSPKDELYQHCGDGFSESKKGWEHSGPQTLLHSQGPTCRQAGGLGWDLDTKILKSSLGDSYVHQCLGILVLSAAPSLWRSAARFPWAWGLSTMFPVLQHNFPHLEPWDSQCPTFSWISLRQVDLWYCCQPLGSDLASWHLGAQSN